MILREIQIEFKLNLNVCAVLRVIKFVEKIRFLGIARIKDLLSNSYRLVVGGDYVLILILEN